MGFEVPAAIGAQVGRPDKTVWSIAGDGGFQMTMCDLATAVENNIPVKYAILNNNQLGMITQWQDFVYNKDFYANAYTGNPDFVKLAEAFGAWGARVEKSSDLRQTLEKAFTCGKPALVTIPIDYRENMKLTERLGRIVADIG